MRKTLNNQTLPNKQLTLQHRTKKNGYDGHRAFVGALWLWVMVMEVKVKKVNSGVRGHHTEL